MRIERIRIAGFGPLAGVDLEWPEGRLLLVLDGNERGKTTLCEAIVAALYGLPRRRGGAKSLREVRRPRGGAPLRVGLDLTSGERRWSVERDLEEATLRVVDRDRGVEATREFLRAQGRDVFGETVTGGLSEPLFRATAYVAQNVLDRDRLDSSLTMELARIADTGGGEASVVRALALLEAVRREMPDARTGATVSIETEIARLGKKRDGLSAERDRLASLRGSAAEASAWLGAATRRRNAARARAEAAAVAVVEAERRALSRRLAALKSAREALAAAEAETAALAPDAETLPAARLAAIDRLRAERGARPEALRVARESLAADEARLSELRAGHERRLEPALSLSPEDRETARRLLESTPRTTEELAAAESEVESQWQELRRSGVADDLRRLEGFSPEDRRFVAGVDEERASFELEGVRLDRKVAEAKTETSILTAERRERVRQARWLLGGAAAFVPVAVVLALWSARPALAIAAAAAALVLGVVAAFAWISGQQHRRDDEERLRVVDETNRQAAADARHRLSELRQRLDHVARLAGLGDGVALVKAQRRIRLAEDSRRRLLEKQARLDAAAERSAQIGHDLAPLAGSLGLPPGFPRAEAAHRALALLREVEEALAEERSSAERTARDGERLAAESDEIARIEARLRAELHAADIPPDLSLPEALAVVEVSRRRLARRARLLEVEIPARREAVDEAEIARVEERLAALDSELSVRRGTESPADAEVEPEEARREAEEARATLESAESARLSAERELAAAAREGGERARETEEALAETEALLDRAVLFRDAVDLAFGALTSSAAAVYGDFRRGLAEASRTILESWRIPWAALEFGDDLSVSAVARDGRTFTQAEIDGAFSTGAREQLHLTARLAVLRYLGAGGSGVPLLLDDPLTGTDDERFVAVMEFLIQRVLPERPVLLVSCHGWRHERLRAALPEAASEQLAVVRLPGPEERAAD
jgi:DNA repair exonuclease SbcCD ATPase subunit